MKTLRLFFMTLALAGIALGVTACSDDDGGDKSSASYSYDGKTYQIKSAGIEYDDSEGAYWIVLSRLNITDGFNAEPDSYITIDLEEDDLGKTVTLSDSHPNYWSFYFCDYPEGISLGDYKGNMGDIVSGSFKASKSGNRVTVEFNVTFDDEGVNKTLSGSYSGNPQILEDFNDR